MVPQLVVLVVVLIAIGLALLALLVLLGARMILCPPRMTDAKAIYLLHRLSPGDLDLAYETENYLVRDGHRQAKLLIAGWWIPAPQPSDRTVILLHGYADAKVGALAWSRPFHDLGWNILAVDLRAHGESGGTFCTGGYWEREDVNQVINQLRAARPGQTSQLVLFGASLGAAVAAATAAGRDDLQGVILESPFTDYARAIAAQARLTGLPAGAFLRATIGCAQLLAHCKFDQVRPVDTLSHARCPVLVILSDQDQLLEPYDIEQFRAAIESRKAAGLPMQLYIAPDATHLMGMDADPAAYSAQLARFLEPNVVLAPAVVT